MNDIAIKAGLALIGVLIGWTGNALTLSGRVDAIERTLQRIETRMDNQGRAQP